METKLFHFIKAPCKISLNKRGQSSPKENVIILSKREAPDFNSVGEIAAHVSFLYSPLALFFFIITIFLRMCDFQQLIKSFKALVNQINLSLIIGLISLS